MRDYSMQQKVQIHKGEEEKYCKPYDVTCTCSTGDSFILPRFCFVVGFFVTYVSFQL